MCTSEKNKIVSEGGKKGSESPFPHILVSLGFFSFGGNSQNGKNRKFECSFRWDC